MIIPTRWNGWPPIIRAICIGLGTVMFATLLMLASFSSGRSSGYYEAEIEHRAVESAAKVKREIALCTNRASQTAIVGCVSEAIKTTRDNERAEEDLRAQQDMAKWGWWLLVASLAQIPISIAGFLALLFTLQQGRKELSHAQTVASMQLRPYVIPRKFRIRKENDYWIAKVRLWNAGVLPAKQVAAISELFYVELPLSRENPIIHDPNPPFSIVAPQSSGIMQRYIQLTPEQEQNIREYRAALLLRVLVEYVPVEGAASETIDELALAVGNDLNAGIMRCVPTWAYEETGSDGAR